METVFYRQGYVTRGIKGLFAKKSSLIASNFKTGIKS